MRRSRLVARLAELATYDHLHRRGIEQVLTVEAVAVGNGVVVDVACGNRPYESLFRGRYVGLDYTTADASPDVTGSASALPLRDRSATLVLSTQYLEHADDPSCALGEMRRLLDVGGTLLLSTHGVFPHHGHPRDFWRWTEDGLVRQVEAAGFRVERVHRQGNVASAGLLLAAYPLSFGVERRPRRIVSGVLLVGINLLARALDALVQRRSEHHYAAISYLVVATAVTR